MKRFMPLLLVLFLGDARASDGELGWTSLSFCNGAGYCVQVASPNGVGVEALRIERNGKEIALPEGVAKGVQLPILNQVRLIDVWTRDGVRENRLEIPFLTPKANSNPIRSVLHLIITDDTLSRWYIQDGAKES